MENEPDIKKTGSWSRQFASDATIPQQIFDWIFGVVMPVVCIVFDPVIFKQPTSPGGTLGDYKPFFYALFFVSIFAMAVYLALGRRLGGASSAFSGLFLVTGVLLIPVSLIAIVVGLLGLIFGGGSISLLGFIPIFVVLVYLRNGIRLQRNDRIIVERFIASIVTLTAIVLAVAIPAAMNREIDRHLERLNYGDLETIHSETAKLKYVAVMIDFRRLQRGYLRGRDDIHETPESRAVGEAYTELTGYDISKLGRLY